MKYAIIAAGEGSRLNKEGIKVPKPLVRINGEALIDRLIRIFTENEAESIIVAYRKSMTEVAEHLDKIKDLDNIEVQDGDDIYIPRTSNHVSVIGEVYNEQSFVFKKGANAKYYIKEVY